MSRVKCQISFFFFLSDKVVKIVGGGSVMALRNIRSILSNDKTTDDMFGRGNY